MLVQLRRLDSIRPYDKNPRAHDKAGTDAVAASIRAFGFRQPIVVDAEGVIIAGHGRYRAAHSLGLEEVPVHVATDLSAEQIRAYRIADNKTNELSEWDAELLPFELSELQACNFDLGLTGFSPEELALLLDPVVEEGLTDPDDVPAPPDEATTKPGDLYILGEHRLLCGSSAKPDDLDKLLDGARIDLVHMDPPYNVAVQSRTNNALAAGTGDRKTDAKGTTEKLRAKDRPIANDNMSEAEYDLTLDAWFGNASRVLKPGGSFYAWGGYANFANYPGAVRRARLHLSQAIVWVKEHAVISRQDFMGNHEWAFYGWKEGAAHRFFGGNSLPDTWELSRARDGSVSLGGKGVVLKTPDGTKLEVSLPKKDSRARVVDVPGDEPVFVHGATMGTDVWRVKKVPAKEMVHVTQKPVELAVRAIGYSSLPGENVLDLFGGSGMTLIAAQQTGRRAFLMELDPLYCDVIVRRWEDFTGQKAVRVPGEPAPAEEASAAPAVAADASADPGVASEPAAVADDAPPATKASAKTKRKAG